MTPPTETRKGIVAKRLTLELTVRSVEGEGWVCEAGREDHKALADWLIEDLEGSNAKIRFVCNSHLKSLESSSSSQDSLRAAVEELKIPRGGTMMANETVTGVWNAALDRVLKIIAMKSPSSTGAEKVE